MDDRDFMETALDLAEKGRGFTSPNPMVGAVVVSEGRIVGQGWHRRAGGAHAEVHAIDDAGEAARGATLYVTLEPCNHTGRTPPCTRKILDAGIERVVVGSADPNPDVRGGGSAFLEKKGLQVVTGVCRRRAERLNESFNKFITTRRPFVIGKFAATLDGRIATRTGDARWVTGESARAYVHRLRHAVDAILVGIGTVETDDPQLTTRIPGMDTRDPLRIVLDTRLRIAENARLLHLDSNAGTLIICGDTVPEERRSRIESETVTVLPVGLRNGRIDLELLMDRLGQMEITSLLIEGGGRVLASAFRQQIVDKCAFFYAPKILGGDDGVPICSGPGPVTMAECFHLKDLDVSRFGEDILVQGYMDRQTSPDTE